MAAFLPLTLTKCASQPEKNSAPERREKSMTRPRHHSHTRGLLFGAAGVGMALISSQASATSTCSSILNLSPFGVSFDTFVSASFLAPGQCAQANDKLFGNFTFGTLPTTATIGVEFTGPAAATPIDDYTLTFFRGTPQVGQTLLGPSATAMGF